MFRAAFSAVFCDHCFPFANCNKLLIVPFENSRPRLDIRGFFLFFFFPSIIPVLLFSQIVIKIRIASMSFNNQNTAKYSWACRSLTQALHRADLGSTSISSKWSSFFFHLKKNLFNLCVLFLDETFHCLTVFSIKMKGIHITVNVQQTKKYSRSLFTTYGRSLHISWSARMANTQQ